MAQLLEGLLKAEVSGSATVRTLLESAHRPIRRAAMCSSLTLVSLLRVRPSLRKCCRWMRARDLVVMCLALLRQCLARITGSTSPRPHLRDSFLLHQARHHSIKAYSLVRAVTPSAPRPQHLCPLLRPSHLSASLLPHIRPLAIVAINFHRYPSRRIIRTFLSIPSTAITTTAISFLTPLNNNSPFMPCRPSRQIVLKGNNAA